MGSRVKSNQLIFAYPGELLTPTGGYAYDRRMIEELKRLGWQIELISLGSGFPYPSEEVISLARESMLNLRLGIPVLMDGLALGVLPELVAELSVRHPVIALIHHPLALETGLSAEQADAFKVSETLALGYTNQVIVTSSATARNVIQFLDGHAKSIQVVMPGTDRPIPKLVPASFSAHPVDGHHLLSVGSVIHRKGFDVLIPALWPLADLPWMLSIVGDITRDDTAYEKLIKDITSYGFEGRVQILGAVTAEHLDLLYEQADIFVLASRFEGYGMAYAEALARGLPIVGTNAGAIPETVPVGAGLLVPPNDVGRLTIALQMVMQDDEYRRRLIQGAYQAAERQPTWEDSAKRFSEIISCTASHSPG